MIEVLRKLEKIYSRLQDEESKKLFDIRLKYSIDRSTKDFFAAVGELYNDWSPGELMDKLKEYPTRDIVVFGSGYVGMTTKILLNCWGFSDVIFCDIQHIGETIEGGEVLSVEKALENYPNALFIIGSKKYQQEMRDNLLAHGVSPIQILTPKHKYLMASRGTQYFDLFAPEPDEVYVDAGVFDGESVLSFCKWTENRYRKIYGFEPTGGVYNDAVELIRRNDIERIELLNCATWNKKEKLYFEVNNANKAGSHVTNDIEDTVMVLGVDIDSVVGDEKVTFIKMDIEGSELRALHGARRTIMACHPRLAISIYHKPEDILEIGDYILQMYPEYKLFIRHYSSNCWETILYAVP